MNYRELLLPLTTNSGKPYDASHRDFKRVALSIVGGITQLPNVEGIWINEGITHYDTLTPYRFLADDGQWVQILTLAHALFPDQITLFEATIGQASCHSIEQWPRELGQ